MTTSTLAAESTVSETKATKRWMPIVGWVLSALPIFGMVLSASMKLMHKPDMVTMFTGKFGWPENDLVLLAILELTCIALYAIPQTAILGAVLVTGYLGGAVATHLRIADNFTPALVLGICAWAGLYLREPRIRALLPLRQNA